MLISASKYSPMNFGSELNEELDLFGNEFIEYIKRSAFLKTYVIPHSRAYRLDLITRDNYGRYDFDWIVVQVNSITFIEELNEGRSLRIPSLPQIEKAYYRYVSNL